ncbi:GIY-YIG nuclease family protein [Flavobacterium reichenbachii]|uniref:GIY-YIG domain-containing protein n=1 Tax=Flavobacterium reichenbachii TaxID=362418 RepID=A0A085ZMJ1_9FLAO|nr:hypothetical protein [Flavobacterium reichenbachii]KFF05655.1 hypothetical protein IW19_09065 [Flavobacterium reichenbachii]OXB17987.1 hypothetical protein B0A68_03370 [Flavobacterium reichenbachii]
MNFKKEAYPENLNNLFSSADKIAKSILEKLNSPECPTVSNLYDSINGKIFINKKKIDELGYSATRSCTNPNDFKGLYVFGKEEDNFIIPVYVGISRTVFRRLRQHAWGKNHNQCSLAYLKTGEKWKTENRDIDRATITNDEMNPARDIIKKYKVVLWPVDNDYELYFLEVTLAGIFKTYWNSFKTH